jgi:ferritin-like metal-binding protein YciE
MPETTTDLLTAYLSDAHSTEEQALERLRDAPEIAGGGSLKAAFRDHLLETEGYERQIREAAQLSLAEAGI